MMIINDDDEHTQREEIKICAQVFVRRITFVLFFFAFTHLTSLKKFTAVAMAHFIFHSHDGCVHLEYLMCVVRIVALVFFAQTR